ncbi:MAG: flagellar biosynthesis anti-sigma factor protein FlgM [Clostridia bacterium]|jgi:negative regulator of flagellin synthesis FlgM|nr:flagellar biosynthesis anti-sigma factor protein FlgM [Clostridia bacterium]
MRIDHINKIYETYKEQAISKTKQVSKVQKKDEVALSKTAKDFQAVYKLLSTTPDIREDKVNEIKEKIKSGNYNVSAEEVADKILSHLDIKG